ncbi:MAG: translational GTPase TypA, partial [Flavobacteriia bacterium]|nr:translational GTPase TypA [Flavobacteriia bacterium]
TIDLPEEFGGTAVEAVTKRKGEMTNMTPKGTRMIIQFLIPSRGIIGLRSYLLTQTGGEAIMTHRFLDYQPFKGEIPGRQNGSMISLEQGMSIPFSLNNLQERGKFFVSPNENIYEGQVIGENSRAGDLCVNVTKTKKMSNMRSSGADEKVRLAPPKLFSLEECLEYIQGDEYVEVTPKCLRIRKIFLKETDRKRSGKG